MDTIELDMTSWNWTWYHEIGHNTMKLDTTSWNWTSWNWTSWNWTSWNWTWHHETIHNIMKVNTTSWDWTLYRKTGHHGTGHDCMKQDMWQFWHSIFNICFLNIENCELSIFHSNWMALVKKTVLESRS